MTVSFIKNGSVWSAFVYSQDGRIVRFVRGTSKRAIKRYTYGHYDTL